MIIAEEQWVQARPRPKKLMLWDQLSLRMANGSFMAHDEALPRQHREILSPTDS